MTLPIIGALGLVEFLTKNKKLVVYGAIIVGLLGWHWWAKRAAYNEGRAYEKQLARIEAGKRIKEMEQSNEKFRSLSARDRCIAFMRDSGLPERHCD